MAIVQRLKDVWSDPVWSAVISAAIVSGLSALFLWALKAQFGWRSTYEVSVFWLSAMLFFAAVSTIAAVRWLSYSRALKRGWRHYTKDMFLGALWHWSYNAHGRVQVLIPFCTICGKQLSYGHGGGSHSITSAYFMCSHCRSCSTVPLQTSDDLFDKVKYLIERNLKDGTWESRLDT